MPVHAKLDALSSPLERGGAQRRGVFVRQSHPPRPRRARAFSLIEVVAALAIFAFGIIVVLALFAPVAKSLATVSEAEAAARVADAVRARLQTLPFADAVALLQDAADVTRKNGDPTYNPNDGERNPKVIFGKLTGDVGLFDVTAKVWLDVDFTRTTPATRTFANADKYFEIDLIRNTALSPLADDPLATMVAYTMRVRWPMFVPSSSGAAVQVGANPAGGAVPFDHSRKQVLFFNGAITR